MKKKNIWVFLDNEGPCTLNDNAQENTVALAKHCGLGEQIGTDFYKRLSVIDDIWGDFHKIAKDPSYSSGHTLKVILPFYKAMGATSQWLYSFAKKNIRVVPHIGEVLAILNNRYNVWQVSTSYEFFIWAFCDLVGFNFNRVHCTFVERFNGIPITKEESEILLDFMKEVAQMPIIEYDKETGEVISEHKTYYERFTNFIWETVYNMPIGKLLRIVHPVGQTQKREAMVKILQKFNASKEKVFYVGDSQTDVQCVQYLKGAGITMMFNGKGKVCNNSDIMYIGENARAIGEVVDLFAEHGRRAVIKYYTPPREAKYGGLLAAVTPKNIAELKEISVKKRKEFRGVHIGELT
ncbi:hypothetical protein KJA15_04020 [Patescibacteria group bacterium]|nr:hypothetical protein [Patescibacteria group bacterium]